MKILLKFLSDQEIEAEFLRRHNAEGHNVEPKEIAEIFDALSGIEGIEGYLQSILRADRVRYFNSPIEAQSYIKGAYSRTAWLLKKIVTQDQKKIISKTPEVFKSPRHA